MAGDGEDGRMYVLLLFITVFMRLAFIRRRSRFQQRLRLLTIRSRMRRTDACSLQLRRKFRKRKIAWVLERPQFWFEHMVLSHYKNNIWREHFRISRQTFRFVCDLGSFVIQPARLVAKILLVEATVDFGRPEKYMDHVRERGRQSDRSQEE